MIIFLYGQDTYRLREEMRKIVEEYKKPRLDSRLDSAERAARQANPDWMDFVRIDANDKQVEILSELKQITDTVSMFSSQKLVIIDNIFEANQDIQEEILEFLKKRNLEKTSDITIIFCDEETDSQSALFKYLQSKAECKEFKLLQGAQLRNWIKDYVVKQGSKIDSQTIYKLIEYIGNDLWRMENEINKLITYKMGDVRRPTSNMLDVARPTLTVADIELLSRPEVDLKIFDLGDAVGQKNKAKAIKLLNQQIEEGENESYLLSMIASQIRNLIKVKSFLQINANIKDSRMLANKLGIHPFVAQKSSQQARNFTIEELKKIYHQLMAIDFESKIGKTDPKTALELFISNL